MEVLVKSSATAATILAITVIGIGNIIFNFASNKIDSSYDDFETSLNVVENVVEPEEDYITSTLKKEAEEFNSAFMKYEGTISGKKVNELLTYLSDNALINKLYEDKLPDLFYEATVNSAGMTIKSDVNNPRAKEFKNVIEEIETTHNYFVTFEYSTIGLIENINIYYARPIYGEY